MWQPEPQPHLLLSISRRFRIRRTAQGYALYDHALGKRIGLHRAMHQALAHKKSKTAMLKYIRDSVPHPKSCPQTDPDGNGVLADPC